jgi:hypothetical protein
MRTKIIAVSFVVALAAAISVSAFVKRAYTSARTRPVRELVRTVKDVLPEIRSTVPGVTMTAKLHKVGDGEFADIIIQNDTDRAIDAYQVYATPFPADGSTTRDVVSFSSDSRHPAFEGDNYKLKPDASVIQPHGRTGLSISLSTVPDGGSLTLTGVVFHDGTTAGAGAKKLVRLRALEADQAGLHDELRAQNAQLAREKSQQ